MSRGGQGVRWRSTLALAVVVGLTIESSIAMELQGHRGARGVLPENTLPGFRHAIAVGADCLELDVAMSRDRQIIITHDPTLNPNLVRKDGAWIKKRKRIKDLTFAELMQFDVGRLRSGSAYAARFPEQRPIDGLTMPLLSELFEMQEVKSNESVCLDIEIKTTPLDKDATFAPEAIADALVALIDKAGLRKRSRVRSFDWRSLVHLRRSAPDVELAFLTAERRWLNNLGRNLRGKSTWLAGIDIDDFEGSPARAIKHLGGAIWAPYYRDLTKSELELAHRLGLKVIVWTVNKEPDIRRMIDLGVDGITTDYPARARAIVDRRAR